MILFKYIYLFDKIKMVIKMIDIIIPCYNSNETLIKTLSSICLQDIKHLINVYIVNDYSDYDYKFYIDFFSNFINISELKLECNLGPGSAREFGMINSNGKYVMFIDSDDYLYSSSSVSLLYNKMLSGNYDVVIGNFLYCRDYKRIVKKKDQIWLHGKMYKRSFITDNNIYFNSSRKNEDNGFNRLIFLLTNNIYDLDEIVYVYYDNINSITRRNNREYRFTGLSGYIYNMCWAMKNALKRGVNIRYVTFLAMRVIVDMYYYYLELYNEFDVDKILYLTSSLKKYLLDSETLCNENYEIILNLKRGEYILSNNDIDEIISFKDFLSKIP